MKEHLLHYVWQSALFDTTHLKTTDGRPIQLIRRGFINTDGGPDFSNARIRIGGQLWIGNVEIHISDVDWKGHGHHNDTVYDTTILHVVYEHRVDVFRTDGSKIPVLELKNRINSQVLNRYQFLQSHTSKIPCASTGLTLSKPIVTMQFERMAIERLKDKSVHIRALHKLTNSNIERCFLILLFESFGMRVNRLPMGLLGRKIDLRFLARHHNKTLLLEAYLFGMAGMLHSEYQDAYPNRLRKEFSYLQHKYGLSSIDPSTWKFLRLRPPNFPTLRLAQLAALLVQKSQLFEQLTSCTRHDEVGNILTVETSPYWKAHYTFDKPTRKAACGIGEQLVDVVILNTIAPIMYFYGQLNSLPNFADRALDLLASVKPENNKVTRRFTDVGFEVNNGLASQGALQLHNKYCTFKRCLECQIGHEVLKRE